MNCENSGCAGGSLPRYKVSIHGGILAVHLELVSRDPAATVFLDRDGVLNRRIVGGYVTDWSQFELLPGVKDAMKKLARSGFRTVIVSNQAGVAKGQLTCNTLLHLTMKSFDEFHRLGATVAGAFFCLHQPSDNCSCRKPMPGLLQKAMRDVPFDPEQSFFVGDSASDIQAGAAVGLQTVALTEDLGDLKATKCVKDLLSAVDWILAQTARLGRDLPR